jgi:hypothetical protein
VKQNNALITLVVIWRILRYLRDNFKTLMLSVVIKVIPIEKPCENRSLNLTKFPAIKVCQYVSN